MAFVDDTCDIFVTEKGARASAFKARAMYRLPVAVPVALNENCRCIVLRCLPHVVVNLDSVNHPQQSLTFVVAKMMRRIGGCWHLVQATVHHCDRAIYFPV